jgi:hypothetical protein
VSGEFLLLEIFNNLNSSMFKALSDQDLENGLSFQVEVKQVKVLVNDLDLLVLTLSVGDKDGLGGSVNIVVRLDISLIDHVLSITELSHEFVTLLLLHHISLLLLLHLVLLLLAHGHLLLLLLPSHLLVIFELLFFNLLVADHLHLSASLVFLDSLLLLHNHGIGLHVDRND